MYKHCITPNSTFAKIINRKGCLFRAPLKLLLCVLRRPKVANQIEIYEIYFLMLVAAKQAIQKINLDRSIDNILSGVKIFNFRIIDGNNIVLTIYRSNNCPSR